MECPHCTKKVSLFSKALNTSSKIKHCPHCSAQIQTYLSLKIIAILFIPVMLLSSFIARPLLLHYGFAGALATGFSVGLIIFLSMRLKAVS